MNRNLNSKSTSSQRKSKKSRLELPIFVIKSPLYSYLNQLRRKNKNFKLKDLVESQSVKATRVPRSTARVVLLIAIVLTTLFFGFNLFRFFNFNPLEYTDSENYRSQPADNTNILFILMNDRLDDYRFADAVSIININKNTNAYKVYGINSAFSLRGLNSKYTIRNFWNNILEEDRTETYVDELENLLGLKFNGYIIADRQNLHEYLEARDFSFSTTSEYAFESTLINKNTKIDANKFNQDAFDHSIINNDLVSFQADFVKAYIQMFKNPLNLYRDFINSDQFLNTFKTNLTRSEVLELLIRFNNGQLLLGNSLLSVDLGQKVEGEDRYLGNTLLIDESIGNFFKDFEIVKEQTTIEIYNATNTSGIATKYQRILNNKGNSVIKVGNYPEDALETSVFIDFVSLEKYRNSINLISEIMGTSVRIINIDEYKYNYSSDIIIVLAEDILL